MQQCPRCGQVVEAAVEPIMCGSSDREGSLTYWRCSRCRAIFSRLSRAILEENTEVTERAIDLDSNIQVERSSRHSEAKAEAIRG
jgi:predicted  nucleic acid-binding Zn-ribbon protein